MHHLWTQYVRVVIVGVGSLRTSVNTNGCIAQKTIRTTQKSVHIVTHPSLEAYAREVSCARTCATQYQQNGKRQLPEGIRFSLQHRIHAPQDAEDYCRGVNGGETDTQRGRE